VADETQMEAPSLFTTMYTYALPQDAAVASMHRTGALGRFWDHRTRAMQVPANAFRRIYLLGASLNRGRG
jgi:hypothetical protein